MRTGSYIIIGLLFFVIGAATGSAKKTTLHPVANPFPAPLFELKGEDGKQYRLADYRGKVVLLNFWATWCPPCRYEMPALERAWQKIRDKGIVILAVNVGESSDTIFEFGGRYNMSFPIPMDSDGSVIKKYPVVGLPTTFVIDPLGNVTHQVIGGREWDNDELLEKLIKMLVKNN